MFLSKFALLVLSVVKLPRFFIISVNDDVALLDEQIPDVDQTSMETPQEQNGESDRNAGMPDLVHDNDPEPPSAIAGKV